MSDTNGRSPATWRLVALGEVLERIEAGTNFKAQDRPAANGEVGVLKLSPDGKLLAMEEPRGAIKLLDASTGQLVRQFPPEAGHSTFITSMAFSNDGGWLVSANGSSNGSSNTAGEVIVWDVKQAKALVTLRGHSKKHTGVAISRNGKWLATSSEDGSVNLWDLDRVIPPSR